MMVSSRGSTVQQPSAPSQAGPWPPGNYQQSGQNPMPYSYPQPPYPPQSPGGYHGGMPPPSYSPTPGGSQENHNYPMYNPQGQQFSQMQHQPHGSANYPHPHSHPGSLGAPPQHPPVAESQQKVEQPDPPSPAAASGSKQDSLSSSTPLPLAPSDRMYRGSKPDGDTAEI